MVPVVVLGVWLLLGGGLKSIYTYTYISMEMGTHQKVKQHTILQLRILYTRLGVAQFPERVRQLFFPIFDLRCPKFCGGIVGQGDAFWYYSMPILWPQFWMRIIIKQPFSQRTRISRKCCDAGLWFQFFSPHMWGRWTPCDEHIFFKGLMKPPGPRLLGWWVGCQVARPESGLFVSSGSEAARLFLSLLTSCLGCMIWGMKYGRQGWLEWWQGRDAFPKPWSGIELRGSWRVEVEGFRKKGQEFRNDIETYTQI